MVGVLAASGEHEDRDGQALRAHGPRDVEAVHVGQAEVEHEDVRLADLLQRALAGAMGADLVALAPEGSGEGLGDGGVVLDEKHSCHDSDTSRVALARQRRCPHRGRAPALSPRFPRHRAE